MTADWRVEEERVKSEAVTVVVGRAEADSETAPFQLRKLRMSEGARSDFRELLLLAVDRARSAEAIAYDVDAELKRGQCFAFEGDDLPLELATFADIASEASTAEPIGPSELTARASFYAAVVGDDSPRVTYLRKADPSVGHDAKRPVFGVRGEQLTRVQGPLFRFSVDFDAVVASSWAVVLSQHRFEQMFRESPIVQKHIATWTSAITDHLPMADGSSEVLQEAAQSDSRLWRKLRVIHQRGHLRQVTPEALRSYAESMDVDADTVLNEANQLVFDSATRFNVIHLLNEDLFRGPLTKEPFEAHRKTTTSS